MEKVEIVECGECCAEVDIDESYYYCGEWTCNKCWDIGQQKNKYEERVNQERLDRFGE